MGVFFVIPSPPLPPVDPPPPVEAIAAATSVQYSGDEMEHKAVIKKWDTLVFVILLSM